MSAYSTAAIALDLQVSHRHKFWSRFKGLMLSKSMPWEEGVLLSPCQHIHTCFMRFPLSILHCDRQGNLCKYLPCVQPWSWSLCQQSYYVFEFNAYRFPSYEAAENWVAEYFSTAIQSL